MIIGYARISTPDQCLDAQHDALNDAGAACLFSETVSGAASKRPELERMLDQLRDSDECQVRQCVDRNFNSMLVKMARQSILAACSRNEYKTSN